MYKDGLSPKILHNYRTSLIFCQSL